VKSFTKELERITKLAATNRAAAEKDAVSLFAKEGADFYKQHAEKYGALTTLELAKANLKNAEQTATYLQRERDRREAAEARLTQARQANDFRLALQANKTTIVGQDKEGNLIVQHGDGRIKKVSGLGEITKIPTAGSGAKASAQNQRYAFNIVEAFGQAAIDLSNITTLPKGTTLGTFAGMTGQSGDSLLSSLRNSFARTVTPDDERAMQQLVSALDFHMSRALGGGYASSSTKSILDAYKSQVAQAGDSPVAQALFLARMKQELKVLRKVFGSHPGANEGYLKDMDDFVRQLDSVIPFEVQDVTNASRGSKESMTDNLKKVYQTPSNIALPQRRSIWWGCSCSCCICGIARRGN